MNMRAVRISAVWQDHAGRFSPLKLITLLLVLWPGLVLSMRWALHDLGGRPVTEMIHGAGDWAVRFLVITLAVSAARPVLDWPRVLLLRRMLGVTTACYAVAHLLLYCVDQKWNLLTVVSEIVRRFYLTIGFVALTGLVALAVTSTDGWQRRMGASWKRLHKLIFPIGALAIFHYFLQSKADVTDAVFLFGLFAWLVLWRQAPRKWQGRLAVLPILAVLAALLTAGVEATWYGLATGVDARRVLLGNLDVSFGLRPAAEVLVLGLLLYVVAALRRGVKSWPGKRRKTQPATNGAAAYLRRAGKSTIPLD